MGCESSSALLCLFFALHFFRFLYWLSIVGLLNRTPAGQHFRCERILCRCTPTGSPLAAIHKSSRTMLSTVPSASSLHPYNPVPLLQRQAYRNRRSSVFQYKTGLYSPASQAISTPLFAFKHDNLVLQRRMCLEVCKKSAVFLHTLLRIIMLYYT